MVQRIPNDGLWLFVFPAIRTTALRTVVFRLCRIADWHGLRLDGSYTSLVGCWVFLQTFQTRKMRVILVTSTTEWADSNYGK